MDVLTVNSLNFLSTISHEIYYRTAQYVKKPVTYVYEGCTEELLAVYRKGGFNITKTHCNNDFRKVMDPFLAKKYPTIKMNYAAAQEHVPQAEQNNCVIQERIQEAYHRFPFPYLPRILVKYLVMKSTKNLNLFTNKQGVSKYFIP